ncbi:MAG: hypothetical protein CVV41_14650 [Candidatus Riflebacteria bacterium HGW-Riflebacteria-1]|jgi:hypothetical protein|nr:MAG: hypothetical protein CVV41_14650 [Candidatus Riflebacteria bacterium HGW-Riflebacteria-1]
MFNKHILTALLLLLLQTVAAPLCAATRVFLASRLEFTPALLDMLRRTLAKKIVVNDTIILQPFENSVAVREASGSMILLEQGMDNSQLPAEHVDLNVCVDLVWVLAASLRVPDLPPADSLSGEQFAGLLQTLKEQSPDRYPWFESLSSRVTLRNFDVVFAEAASATGVIANVAKLPFWQQSDSIAFLYRAIEEHYLNPFSIESDLGLAMNVFAAEDAMFVSHWVPAEFLDDERLCRENMGKVRLLPFPVLNNKKFLRIRLRLYGLPSVSSRSVEAVELSDDERFIDLDYKADSDWIEKKSADKYDALIVGGF